MKKIVLFLFLCVVLSNCKTTKNTISPADSAQTSSNSAGGDGSSFEKAVVIRETSESTGIKSEYAWLKNTYPGYQMIRQSLVYQGKKPYDIITIKTAAGDTKDVFFDISNFFGKF